MKLALLALDHDLRFFLGDSASYLLTAVTGWIPQDRSFLYGFLIGWLSRLVTGLGFVIFVQVCASAFTVWMLAEVIERRGNSTIERWRWSLALVMALAPIQLAYERFILTECLTAFALAGYLAAGVRYLAKPGIGWIGVLAALSYVLVALRVSILPNILVGMVGLPLLAFLPVGQGPNGRPRSLRRFGSHFLLFLIVTGGALWCYRQTYAKLSGQPPGYHSRQGYFLLATVSPLLEREDFPDSSLQDAVYAPGGFDLRNADLRNMQLFSQEGLLPRMERHLGNPISADRLARKIAVRAITERPIAFLLLGWQNARLYLDGEKLAKVVRRDLGDREVSAGLKERLSRNFHSEYRPFDGTHSLTSAYLASATLWFRFLVLATVPVGVIALVCFLRGQRVTAFIGLNLLVSIGVSVWLAPAASVRYLHSVELLFILTIGLLILEILGKHRISQDVDQTAPEDGAEIKLRPSP